MECACKWYFLLSPVATWRLDRISIHKDNTLWQRLFSQEFGHLTQTNDTAYKKLYGYSGTQHKIVVDGKVLIDSSPVIVPNIEKAQPAPPQSEHVADGMLLIIQMLQVPNC